MARPAPSCSPSSRRCDVTPRAELLVCAFNKSIEIEISGKLKEAGYDWKQVQAKTIHGLGYGLVRFVFRDPTIDEKKVNKIVEARGQADNDPECVWNRYPAQIIALVGYAKQEGFGFFPDRQIGDYTAWYHMADHYDVNGLDDTSETDLIVEAAQWAYKVSLAQTNVIDFDDMVLFPLVKNLRVKFGKDIIFGDEWQDLSRAKQALVKKFLKPNTGRLVMVGDDRQAIYGFTGADAAAMPNGIKAMNATVLPLSVTWRCPRAVVKLAQSLVPDIEAAPSAPEGLVEGVRGKEPVEALLASLGPTDAVLCRNMAPLIDVAFKMIRAKKPVKVEGRNIGDGLIALARRWKVRTIDAYLNRLDAYQDREIQKAQAKDNERKAEEVADRCETMRVIAQATREEGGSTVDDIVAWIERLFADGAENVTVCATYHRSKGREWPRVVLWEHGDRCPSRAAKQDWQLQQEKNLAYVAFTRAQSELVFVSDPGTRTSKAKPMAADTWDEDVVWHSEETSDQGAGQ